MAELEGERQDMSGLLGGYQTSIQQLQDEHSAVVVRLQGENAALRAEVGWWGGGAGEGAGEPVCECATGGWQLRCPLTHL